ncbi:MAG: response regulator [Rubrobacter sp.]|nr:response regulator [Rubrobacter sp.]
MVRKLNQEPGLEVVWQAGSLEEAHGIHLDGIDLAIVDPVLLDGDDGMVLVREMSQANPNASVLVLTSNLDPTVRGRALEAGAVEVLSTRATGEELINAIRR